MVGSGEGGTALPALPGLLLYSRLPGAEAHTPRRRTVPEMHKPVPVVRPRHRVLRTEPPVPAVLSHVTFGVSCHVTSCHTTTFGVSRHVTSLTSRRLGCHVTHFTSRHGVWECHVTSRHAMHVTMAEASRRFTSRHLECASRHNSWAVTSGRVFPEVTGKWELSAPLQF